MSTPKSVIELAKKSGAKMVDIKFVDTFGTWQHFSCPIRELTEEVFTEGLGFDGSTIRGWKSIEASRHAGHARSRPRPSSIRSAPCPRCRLTCTIAETGTKEPYSRDPRGIAQKAEKYLASTGLADTAVFGPEAEFFIFDNVQYRRQEQRHLLHASIPRKPSGTPAATRCPTSATRSATRKATSRSPRRTRSRTSAPRCAW